MKMENEYVKSYSMLLAIREMLIKATMSYHYTHFIMTKMENIKCYQGCGDARALI